MPGRQTLTDFGLALLIAIPASTVPDTSPRSPELERASDAAKMDNEQLAHRSPAKVAS